MCPHFPHGASVAVWATGLCFQQGICRKKIILGVTDIEIRLMEEWSLASQLKTQLRSAVCLSFPTGGLGLFNRVKLRMLFSMVLGGGRTVSTWSCVDNRRLRKKPDPTHQVPPSGLAFCPGFKIQLQALCPGSVICLLLDLQ